MRIRRFRSFICIALSILMVMTNLTYADTAKTDIAKCPDIVGNKYEAQLREWVDNGFIKGDPNGNFRPENTITRAEFMALVNRSFGFTEAVEINYTDVPKDKWFYNDAAIATKAGYMQGSNGRLTPLDPISRQEFATVLVRLTGSTAAVDDKVISGLADGKSIPGWSKASISTAMSKGYFEGFVDKSFKPTEKVSRAETVVALDRAYKGMYKAVYSRKGTYGPESGMQTLEGSAVIISQDVTLKNTTVNGDLILRESIGDGNVYLDNVVVKGTTFVKGGGENSIVIRNSSLGRVIVRREGNVVRIIATGSTTVGEVDIQSGATLQEEFLTGEGFGDVVIPDDIFEGATIVFEGAFDDIQVDSSNVSINVETGTIGNLTLTQEAAGATVNLSQQASVNTLNLNAAVSITGQGTIQTANVNAQGATIQQTPQNTVTAPGVTTPTPTPGPTTGPTPAPTPGPTPPPTPPSGGGSGSGGGGGGDDDDDDDDKGTITIEEIKDFEITENNFKDITVTCYPNDAARTAVTSDANIAAVTMTNNVLRVTGVAPGTANITVTASGSMYYSSSRTFKVTVLRMPTVNLGEIADVSVKTGESQIITVSSTTPTISISAVSDKTSVATVAVDGMKLTVTGVAEGTADITVTAKKSGHYDTSRTFKVTVEEPALEVNKEALIAAITAAQIKADNADVGVEIGEYPQSAVDALLAAIATAQAVADDDDATQENVDSAVITLSEKVREFEESVIKAQDTYIVTVFSNPANGGQATVTGKVYFEAGDQVTVTATPNIRYRFINWTNDNGSEESTDDTYTFSMPTNNVSLTANFELVKINIINITVTGANGATTIGTNGGTLQISVQIEPENATDKTVTWSVENVTGEATIDGDGLLSAVANGIVKVIATANDESGVTGELEITISNQGDEEPEVNKEDLQEAIDAADMLNAEDYTEESWAAFQTAFGIAKNVNDDINATQEEVDTATSNLNSAIDALEEVADPIVVTRADNEVTQDPGFTGGTALVYSFAGATKTLTIDANNTSLPYYLEAGSTPPTGANWV
ncbi:MAG TPA: S-layer homology domain-containing protein, partial [Clostridia bacterium]|nr:S-layer homology domain-containing protein [Clostridia bacterium]